tara:strand:+ start:850 stop:1185 length:336 start_codon:yes stop_codon:yes gene_type:complete
MEIGDSYKGMDKIDILRKTIYNGYKMDFEKYLKGLFTPLEAFQNKEEIDILFVKKFTLIQHNIYRIKLSGVYNKHEQFDAENDIERNNIKKSIFKKYIEEIEKLQNKVNNF